MQKVYVARTPEEKEMQRALMQYFLPRNAAIVRKALKRAGREDLIGTERHCLVPPERRTQRPEAQTPGKQRHPKGRSLHSRH